MKVLMPDEVEKQNIITKRELRAILTALMPYGSSQCLKGADQIHGVSGG